MKTGPKPISSLARFLVKIQVSDAINPLVGTACWIWIAAKYANGYGHFQNESAHRWAFQYWIGPIPADKCLDHLCCVRECVNPDHLEAVTRAENTRRGYAGHEQAARQFCPKGHGYSEKNTLVQKRYDRIDLRFFRSCKLCHLIRTWQTRGKSEEEIAKRLALREAA